MRRDLELNPRDASMWDFLADLLIRANDLANAEKAARESVRLDPTAGGWKELVRIYDDQKDWDRLINAANEAIRLEPAKAPLWVMLGIGWARKGDRTKVREIYERLKELDPTLAEKLFKAVQPLNLLP